MKNEYLWEFMEKAEAKKRIEELTEKLIVVPKEVDNEVAVRKLNFLGKQIDTLTPEQEKYLYSSAI